jgi:hypothetical protein
VWVCTVAAGIGLFSAVAVAADVGVAAAVAIAADTPAMPIWPKPHKNTTRDM